ncbi:MAG: uracil-DNA glycosylase [Deltaproteobacteria bacterium]|nr:uracil-DNA glycosylase [Deltaproteobacteria bacterium]
MKDIHQELKEVVSSLKGHLVYQRDILLAEGAPISKSPESGVRSQEKKAQSSSLIPHPSSLIDSQLPTPNSQLPTPNSQLLLKLISDIGDCQRCKLGKTRTKLVFGVGNPDARIVFVGEGPGKDEDIQGEPFVGKAGQLLTDIISKGMKMRREEVYICNVVKCRPPENRNPEPDEVDACEGFLIKQLEVIKPEIVVALGTFAAQTLLKTDLPISELRGRFHDYKGIQVMPTFHPSYLLRNPEKKKETWEDIKMVLARSG